jgi:AmiR/NasT family two-component response regulator
LLGVHRGGRQKAKAVQQIAQAIVADPARVESLLPVLAVAVRSVRGPETRAGLAAVVSLVEAQPQLTDAVRRHLPELKFEEVAA